MHVISVYTGLYRQKLLTNLKTAIGELGYGKNEQPLLQNLVHSLGYQHDLGPNKIQLS